MEFIKWQEATMTKPRLIDQTRDVLRLHHYSIRTEENYIQWIKRFIFFHNKRILRRWVKRKLVLLLLIWLWISMSQLQLRIKL